MFSRVGVCLPKGGSSEHSAVAFNHGNTAKVVMFGGWNGAYHTNELAVLSTDAPGAASSDGWEWEPLKVTGRGPSPRSGHTATPLDDNGSSMLVFGGEYATVGRKYYATADILECSTLTWRPLETVGRLPRARAHHAATHVGGGVVLIFGGASSYGGGFYLNDLHELNCAKGEWHAWSSTEEDSFVPLPRMGHSLTFVETIGGALLFGGEDAVASFNDVAVFETGMRAWRPLQLSGMSPLPRAGHSATLVSPSRLYVFGGRSRARADAGARAPEFRYLQDISILDLSSMTFSQPALSSRVKPSPRAFHSATTLIGSDGIPYILVLGGRSDSRLPHSDALVLDAALLAGVQDYADGYSLLSTQLQSARIEAAKAIDARENAEQNAAEALDESAASARDADAVADALAAARAEIRNEEERTQQERERVQALAATLREAHSALAEQRAALAHAIDMTARLATDRAADAREAQRINDEVANAARTAVVDAERELREVRQSATALKAKLEAAEKRLSQRDEEEELRTESLRVAATTVESKFADALKITEEAQISAAAAVAEAATTRARADAAAQAMAEAHAREVLASETRADAAQARADVAVDSASTRALAAAEAARAQEVELTSLRAQLSHTLSLEQAGMLRLRDTQAECAAEASELRQALAATAKEADDTRQALRDVRADGSEALSELRRKLGSAHTRIVTLDESRAHLEASWLREREALVVRIEELAADQSEAELSNEMHVLELEASRVNLLSKEADAKQALAAKAEADHSLVLARSELEVCVRVLGVELGGDEELLEYALRANSSLARAKAEAEARASQIDAAMRGRLTEVTRALTAEARMTEDLLVGSLPPGRLTMRSGYSAEDDYLPVSPGLAVPRAVGLAGGADAPGGA